MRKRRRRCRVSAFGSPLEWWRDQGTLYGGLYEEMEAGVLRDQVEDAGMPMGIDRLEELPAQLTNDEARGQWGGY
jgi:hypothetical protein